MDSKFIPIYLTVEACNFIIAALRKLPHEQVHELVVDIAAQSSKAQVEPEPEQTELDISAE
jgi:hypothetical protein